MLIRWLGEEGCHEAAEVGGKAASLSRLAQNHRVPPGFALTSRAATTLAREMHASTVAEAVRQAYTALAERCAMPEPAVAVRSSAVDEDGAESSFAGQHQTFLNVRGYDAIIEAVGRCVASGGTPEALAYRSNRGLDVSDPMVAVLVQALVPSDVSIVAFSANPISRSRDEIVINASWGLGESIVGGTVTPDTYVVRKSGLERLSTALAVKAKMTVLVPDGTLEVTVPRILQDASSLEDAHVDAICRLALDLEAQVGACVDIEAAIYRGELYLLQCRPITTLG